MIHIAIAGFALMVTGLYMVLSAPGRSLLRYAGWVVFLAGAVPLSILALGYVAGLFEAALPVLPTPTPRPLPMG